MENWMPSCSDKRNNMKRHISNNYVFPEPPSKFERQHSASTLKDKLCLSYIITVFKNITVQGLVHFTYSRRHVAEHLMWLVILLLCLLCTISLCNVTWRRYKDNPTVISLERDSMAWNISCPAVYLCPTAKYDEDELEKLVANLSTNSNVAADTLRSYLKAVANLTYDTMSTMKPFENITELPQTGLLDIVEKIQYKFVRNGEITEENNIFHRHVYQIMTENGICYAHNSLFTPIVALEKGNNQNLTYNVMTFTAMKAMKAITVQKIKTNYDVFVESSKEVPDWLSVARHYKHGFVVSTFITVRTLYSTTAVRELDVHHRKCRFFDESDLAISPKYSYNLCMMQCRKDMVQKWCHCSPYFYGRLGHITECGIKGMLCIAKLIDKLRNISDTTCKCYQPCDIDSYGILEEKSSQVNDDTDFFGGTRYEWRVPNSPTIRLKKDILFSSTNLLESFGGTVNLFLGASILSGIEVIYYCTIHLVLYLLKH